MRKIIIATMCIILAGCGNNEKTYDIIKSGSCHVVNDSITCRAESFQTLLNANKNLFPEPTYMWVHEYKGGYILCVDNFETNIQTCTDQDKMPVNGILRFYQDGKLVSEFVVTNGNRISDKYYDSDENVVSATDKIDNKK